MGNFPSKVKVGCLLEKVLDKTDFWWYTYARKRSYISIGP